MTSDNPDFGSFGQTTKAHTGVGIAQPKTASRKHAPTPSIEMSPNAKAYVTSVIKPVMAPLEAIVLAKASEVRLRVRGLRWTVFKFKDEKRTDVVLRVSVAAKREQALAFWEYLGSRIDEWLGRLPEQTADVVQDRVSVEIVWQ